MTDYEIRLWKPEDRAQLHTLWKTAFGDSDEYIDLFYERFLRPGTCVVAEADGAVVSAMYVIPDLSLNPYRKNRLTAGYTYALATLPSWRSRGIGKAVYRAANELAHAKADIAAVLPAEKELYPFYETAADATPLSFIREAHLTRDELTGIIPCGAARVPALKYAGMREELLGGMPHVTFPLSFFDLMEETGMEFFVLERGLAAAETNEDGICVIHELLDLSEDAMSSVAGIARWCSAREYIVRTPLFYAGPGENRPQVLGVMKAPPSYPMPNDLWWGFGLE